MYDHRQNKQLADPASKSTPNHLLHPQRRPYDEESRVSTDNDLDLTDFDDDHHFDYDEGGDAGHAGHELLVVENRSTFSGLLMRRLQALEQQQHHPLLVHHNYVDQPGELIRPPLLAVADDSFSAKMRRVLKWTHSLPSSDAVSESSESSVCSPATVPTPILSILAPSTQSRKRRLSGAFFPDDDDIPDITQQPHHQRHHHRHHHHHHPHMLKRPRIAGILTPSAPGSPFFSSAPRLYPFPISTSQAPPTSAAQAMATADHDHRLRPKSSDSCNTNYNNPPSAKASANSSASVTANPPDIRNPIGNIAQEVKVVVPVQSQSPPPSAQVGNALFIHHNHKNCSHVCIACDGSSRCFIRSWHTSSTSIPYLT